MMTPLRYVIVLQLAHDRASLRSGREPHQKGRESPDGGTDFGLRPFKRYVQVLETRLAKLEQLVERVRRTPGTPSHHPLISYFVSIVLVTRHVGITTEFNSRPYSWER